MELLPLALLVWAGALLCSSCSFDALSEFRPCVVLNAGGGALMGLIVAASMLLSLYAMLDAWDKHISDPADKAHSD